MATTLPKPSNPALTDLIISDNKGSELQLEVKQMPLAQVVDAIAEKTKVPIHYSVLPEGLATATCVGTSLQPVLTCLLDGKADLIVRYARSSADGASSSQIVEAWILGSRLNGTAATANCPATSAGAGMLKLRQHENDPNAEPDRTDELLKMAQAKSATDRADAIGQLLAGGRKGDPAVKAALEQALADPDAKVRAQAISTLAHREGGSATAAIQEALHDHSVDVRMMAVDGITDDVALLQQAVNDNDEAIRSLAALKLEMLTQNK